MTESDCMACRTSMGFFADDEVYRDDRVVGVVAQQAINPGHLVVVTREHVRNALTMDDDLLCHMMRVAARLGARLREALSCSGIMLVFNNEPPCQTVFHAHLHVVPREHGDEMDRTYGAPVPPEQRAAMAARLRAAMSPLDTGARIPNT